MPFQVNKIQARILIFKELARILAFAMKMKSRRAPTCLSNQTSSASHLNATKSHLPTSASIQTTNDARNSPATTSKSQKNQVEQANSERSAHYVCAACNKLIKRDKYLLRACDKFWHENCLKCDRCRCRLGEVGSTLYTKANMILCRTDYLDMFGQSGVCSLCFKLIAASELVMRAKDNVYHLECFACQICNQR